MKHLKSYLESLSIENYKEIKELFIDLTHQDFIINVNSIVLKEQRYRITKISECAPPNSQSGRLKARAYNIKNFNKYPKIEILIRKKHDDNDIRPYRDFPEFNVKDTIETILFAKSYITEELGYDFYGIVACSIGNGNIRGVKLEELDKLDMFGQFNFTSVNRLEKLYLYFS